MLRPRDRSCSPLTPLPLIMYIATITGQQDPPSSCHLSAGTRKVKATSLTCLPPWNSKSHLSIGIHLCHFRIMCRSRKTGRMWQYGWLAEKKKYCWKVGGIVYGKSREVQRVYQEHFPNGVSRLSYVASVDHRLWENRTFGVNRHSTGQGWSVYTLQFDTDILQCFENIPSASICAIGHAVIVGLLECCTFYWQKVQALGPNDYLGWDQFVHWFVHQSTEKCISCSVVVYEWGLLQVEGDFQQSKQPCLGRSKPSSCICSLPPKTLLQSMFGQALCMTDWALLVTLTVQCTDWLGVSGGKATRNAGGYPIGTQVKRGSSMMGLWLTLHVTSLVTGSHISGFLPMGPH